MSKTKNNQPIPNWLFEYIQDARLIFGVNGPEWSFHSKMSDRPGEGHGDASTSTNWTYLNVRQEYATTLEEGKVSQAVAIHEVGHAAMVEMDETIQEMAEYLPENVRSLLKEQYDSASERFLQRLSRSIVHYYVGGTNENATKKPRSRNGRSA
jgi:hypothetical protein